MEGRRAFRHRSRRGIRVPGSAVSIAVRDRASHHWHALERPGVLWTQKSKGGVMKNAHPIKRKLRCAVYTRKSSEEGLDQEFNSLDAQRESGEAYVVSQKA